MTTSEIRTAFLNFFASKNHQKVDSSSLVPHNDPTLLFTNAGMNQFKDTFLGVEKRPYTRAATSQKCVRAGGKHNDLENVGYTARHHTFFEMLGNFSFGDYFKQDAINFAWEFLTSEQWLNLPAEKLWVTVYHTDDEAFDIWHKDIGLEPNRIIRIGDKGKEFVSDNFWSMGDTGPCGPCSEIFYDHGEDIEGGLPGTPEEDGDRYIEIWNIVFMQFNRQSDGTMHKLPAPSVDTGMGLERISAVKQNVHSNYEIDIFVNLIKAVADEIGVTGADLESPSLKVVADHLRSCSFLIADGVIPSNEGRGYVLRRIIRRAVRHGYKLGAQKGFFAKLLMALIQEMGEAYPQLHERRELITSYLTSEEEQFSITLHQGIKILEDYLKDLRGKTIDGEMVFKLYDTYGFPADLTGDIARERGLEIDWKNFELEMQAQRKRAKAANKFSFDYNNLQNLDLDSEFLGYQSLDAESEIIAILDEVGNQVEKLDEGASATLVLAKTPFYGEGGGQVGDTGKITTAGAIFEVEDTKKNTRVIFHQGKIATGALALGDKALAQVDRDQRIATACNHSATHLLHSALRQVLGADKVMQKGSLVAPDRLRFDFSFNKALSAGELREVEAIVNNQIRLGGEVTTEVMTTDKALQKGAIALFGEKYADEVRVLTMGVDEFSIEFCGGTHVHNLGNIGLFHIVSEAAIASGIRRIEALTGAGALDWYNRKEKLLGSVAEKLKTNPDEVLIKLNNLQEEVKNLEKELQTLKTKEALNKSGDLVNKAVQIVNGAYSFLCEEVEGVDKLRDLHDQLKQKLKNSLIVLATKSDDKVSLLIGVNGTALEKFHAGNMIKELAGKLDGKGGGKADLAQAGAKDTQKVNGALADLRAQIV